MLVTQAIADEPPFTDAAPAMRPISNAETIVCEPGAAATEGCTSDWPSLMVSAIWSWLTSFSVELVVALDAVNGMAMTAATSPARRRNLKPVRVRTLFSPLDLKGVCLFPTWGPPRK